MESATDFPTHCLLSWWHLSDVHVSKREGSIDDNDDLVDVTKKLYETISEEWQRSGRKPDFVFFTGDVAIRGRTEDYTRASEFFASLNKGLGVGKEQLFVVPGNHDFDRNVSRPGDVALEDEEKKTFSVQKVGKDLTADDVATMSGVSCDYFAPLDNYNNWVREYFGNDELTLTSEKQYYVATRVVEESGLRVSIVGLNTVLNSYERRPGETDQGHVVLGRELVEKIIEELELDPPDLTFVLGHFPLNWISEREAGLEVGRKLRNNSDFYLSGHVHEYGLLQTNREKSRLTRPDLLPTSLDAGIHPYFEITTGALKQEPPFLYPNTAILGEILVDESELTRSLPLSGETNSVRIELKPFTYFKTQERFAGDIRDIIVRSSTAEIIRNRAWCSNRERKFVRDLEQLQKHIRVGNLDLPCAILPTPSRDSELFREDLSHSKRIVVQFQNKRANELPKSIPQSYLEFVARLGAHIDTKGFLRRTDRSYIRLIDLPRIVDYPSGARRLIIPVAANPDGWGFLDSLYRSNLNLEWPPGLISMEKEFCLANVALRMSLVCEDEDQQRYLLFRLRRNSDSNRLYKNTWDAGVVGHLSAEDCKEYGSTNRVLFESARDKACSDAWNGWLPGAHQDYKYCSVIREFPLGNFAIIGLVSLYKSLSSLELQGINKGFLPEKVKLYQRCPLTPRDLAEFISESKPNRWTPGAIFGGIQALRLLGRDSKGKPFNLEQIESEFDKKVFHNVSFDPFDQEPLTKSLTTDWSFQS